MLLLAIAALSVPLSCPDYGQAASGASLCGTVQDQTGASLTGTAVHLASAAVAYDAVSDRNGEFCFTNLDPADYRLAVQFEDFRNFQKDFMLHAGASARLTIVLKLASVNQQVTVAEGAADAASLNVAETKIGAGLMQNLPSESVNAALSSILTLATPGVAADSNGVFHPLGEHAETSFSVDGQPISDQQSRIFSNQISATTLEEMRTLQGAPPAEFGDKTSLIVEVTTRSGLDAGKTNGTISVGYGSFATPTAAVTLASGSSRLGNFLSLDAVTGSRFLDSPEFQPLHAHGNAETLFDRLDWRPNPPTAFHANVSAARSWFQVPNTHDQQTAVQDERQHMTSFNLALAFSRVLSPSLLLTANTWVRQDRVGYFPSANAFSDRPATLSQSRRLTSTGFRSDLAYSRGRHNLKAGIQLQVTPLSEAFSTGLTDPAFNSPCTDAAGVPWPDPLLKDPTQCAGAGFLPNPGFQPALLPYDLTRAGALFRFRGTADIYEGSSYVQDSISFGSLHLNLGLRYDQYAGLSNGFGIEPRTGVTYQASKNTLFHFSYAKVFLTPYNENLVLSSSTGAGGLANGSLGASAVQPLTPARRNQFNAGFQQQLGGKLNIQAQYFWKFTRGAYDFNTILNTPLNFPIQFRQSKIDGALIRATLSNWHGLSAFTVMGHSRSRLFSPEIGGINFGTAYAPVARPDHDQDFEQTTNVQYQFAQKKLRELWIGATWRFDSGLVVVSVPDYATALTLTGDEQQEMGLYCGAVFATVNEPIRACSSPSYGATRIQIPAPGSYDPDTNPTRISPRNLFDVALGSDSLWKKDSYSLAGKLTIVNLTNRAVLYNFLSSFSGTHFVSPRTVQADMTFHF
jgi:carboxypeptidase family protein/TonB-dependent receptor-like protein